VVTETPEWIGHESGIEYLIQERGQGDLAVLNDVVKVHYVLMLEDSTVIDSSRERGEPVSFKLGAGQVIKGWDVAFTYLHQGDKAWIRIPPDLGYGDRAMGNIPPNSLLIFDVEVVDIIRAPEPYSIDEKTTVHSLPSGLRYSIVDKGKGKKLEEGMRVKVHYTGFFEDLSMFDSSVERDQPIEIILGRGMVIKGWEEGLAQLRVGDKARLWIPYQMAYGEQGRGPIPPRADLIFDVEVLQAEAVMSAIPYDVHGRDTIATESGLKYIVVAPGRGEEPASGSMVVVHYTGYLTDGTMFDSSVERGTPFRFVLGQGQVIPGWDQGVALMRPGAKYRLIIPAELGYGDRGAGPIPPGSTLIFDVEFIDIE
jgi:peptidylprolyl isomerase